MASLKAQTDHLASSLRLAANQGVRCKILAGKEGVGQDVIQTELKSLRDQLTTILRTLDTLCDS